MRLYRCLLFVPGNDLKKMSKALSSGADGIILDLEDAVSPGQKVPARETVRDFLNSNADRHNLFARVNPATSPYFLGDLLSLAGLCPLSGIVLAKTGSGGELKQVDWLAGLLEAERGLPQGSIEIMPFIESARALENVFSIAQASPRVRRLLFGGNDFATDMGVNYDNTGYAFYHARAQIATASRAAGLQAPLDTVNPDFKDTAQLIKDAQAARKLGFQGKLAIHPAQVGPIQEVFAPTEEEVVWARKVLDSFSAAQGENRAVSQVDGRMMEYPVVSRARQILSLAGR